MDDDARPENDTAPLTAKQADLGAALINLANAYCEADRLDEALQSAEESEAIFRNLSKEEPDPKHLAPLAASLTNKSAILRRLGRFDLALQSAQQVVFIRRDLAQPS